MPHVCPKMFHMGYGPINDINILKRDSSLGLQQPIYSNLSDSLNHPATTARFWTITPSKKYKPPGPKKSPRQVEQKSS